MTTSRRIGSLVVAALLGAVLAVTTQADAQRAGYAEVAAASIAQLGPRARKRPLSRATAGAASLPGTLAASARSSCGLVRPPVLHTPIHRRLYRTHRALLI